MVLKKRVLYINKMNKKIVFFKSKKICLFLLKGILTLIKKVEYVKVLEKNKIFTKRTDTFFIFIFI